MPIRLGELTPVSKPRQAPGVLNRSISPDPLSGERYSKREKVNAQWRASASLRELEHIGWGKHVAARLPQICPSSQTNEL